MKKFLLLITIMAAGQLIFAQSKPDAAVDPSKPSPVSHYGHRAGYRHHWEDMMKDLNLSDAQKSQIKDIRISGLEKQIALLKNDQLTEQQRHTEMKELRKSQYTSMQRVFTDEQKAKMKAARDKMQADRKHDHDQRKSADKKANNSSPAAPAN